MTTRRRVLAGTVVALGLAGCSDSGDGGSGGSDGDDGSDGGDGSDGDSPGLAVEASDTTVSPGAEARVEVLAFAVGSLTWGIADIPEGWQVNFEDFAPEPTAVEESYPPRLLWDPPAEEVEGVLTVAVPADAEPGTYTLRVEGSGASGDESATSEATVTVEG